MGLLSAYTNQTFTHSERTGNDANGQAAYATGRDRLGRIEERLRLFKNGQGETVQSVAVVYFEIDPDHPIAPNDRITYLGRTWQVLAVEAAIWGNGTNAHARAYLGAG